MGTYAEIVVVIAIVYMPSCVGTDKKMSVGISYSDLSSIIGSDVLQLVRVTKKSGLLRQTQCDLI